MKLAVIIYILSCGTYTKTDDDMSVDAFAQVANPVSNGSRLPPSTSTDWSITIRLSVL